MAGAAATAGAARATRAGAGCERAAVVFVTVALRAAGVTGAASAATESATNGVSATIGVSGTIGATATGAAATGAGVTTTGAGVAATGGATLWANDGVEKAMTAAIAVIAGRIFASLWVMIRGNEWLTIMGTR